jgi:hypothetical protein
VKIADTINAEIARVDARMRTELQQFFDSGDRDGAVRYLSEVENELCQFITKACNRRLHESPPKREKKCIYAVLSNPRKIVRKLNELNRQYIEKAFATASAFEDSLGDIFT